MRLRVAYTSNKRILAIPCPTAISRLLDADESIVQNWYYDQPRELESYFKQNPDKEDDVLKAFSYWIMSKVMGFEEEQNKYGTIKRELQQFDRHLFKSLRSIAGRIAHLIREFMHPKKIKEIY